MVNDISNFIRNFFIFDSIGILLLSIRLLVVIVFLVFIILIILVLLIGVVFILYMFVVPFFSLLIGVGAMIDKIIDLIETLGPLVESALNSLIDHKLSILKIGLMFCFDLGVNKFSEEDELGM